VIEDAGLVKVDDVASTLGVKPTTVQEWVRNGSIPKHTYLKVGKTYRFDLKAVINALRAGTAEIDDEGVNND